ncbi:MAG TPA: hypothetical protein VGD49_13490 [Longimicrobiales bacterium]
MVTATATKEISGRAAFAVFLAWFLSYFGARMGLEIAQSTWLRIALAILPVPFFVGVIRVAFRAIGSGDELFRRIHLEALAFAFPVTVTLLMVLGLFELATGLNPDDFSYRHVWPMAIIAYYGGWALAMRRYR